MVPFVPECRTAHNARPASPAQFRLVAFQAAPDRSQLLLRGPHDGNGASAHRHAMLVARALVDRHGGDVVVLLLGQAGEVLRRVSADTAPPRRHFIRGGADVFAKRACPLCGWNARTTDVDLCPVCFGGAGDVAIPPAPAPTTAPEAQATEDDSTRWTCTLAVARLDEHHVVQHRFELWLEDDVILGRFNEPRRVPPLVVSSTLGNLFDVGATYTLRQVRVAEARAASAPTSARGGAA